MNYGYVVKVNPNLTLFQCNLKLAIKEHQNYYSVTETVCESFENVNKVCSGEISHLAVIQCLVDGL